jgi:hypothetical protein
MATLTPSKSKYSTGILRPLLANKFQVLYRSGSFNNKACAELTVQTVKIKTDFKNKQISFSIEQSLFGEVLELLHDLISYPGTVTIQAMDGDGGVLSSIDFSQLKTISHEFELDYASPSRAATHEVVMEYNVMSIKSIQPEVK